MIIIVMGVAGSGKTTVGSMLARELGWEFHDGDSFHPGSNISKMKQGIPLTDDDRLPWLNAIQQFMRQSLEKNRQVVIACSALKNEYRKILLQGEPGVEFVYLKGSVDLIRDRMNARTGHFMNPKLVDSQFAALEEPEVGITLDVTHPPEVLVAEIRRRLQA